MLSADLASQMIRNGDLQEVSGNALMAENRPWLLNGGADVKILALRIVRRNEEEAAGVLIIDARRIHEATGTSRLECLRQLANVELSQIWRQSDQPLLVQKIDHLCLPAFISLQKRL